MLEVQIAIAFRAPGLQAVHCVEQIRMCRFVQFTFALKLTTKQAGLTAVYAQYPSEEPVDIWVN